MKKGVLILFVFIIVLLLFLVYSIWFSDIFSRISGQASLSSINCTDSDNGDRSFIKGVVFYRWINYTDYCYEKNTKLIEYYCFNGLKDKSYKCKNGCKDGACIYLNNTA